MKSLLKKEMRMGETAAPEWPLEALKEAVLEKKPVLREIMQKRGDKKLYEYAKDYLDVNYNPPIRQRQSELISTFQRYVEKRLGREIAQRAVKQLEKYYFVSTADHHGPICHPFFITSNLLTAAPYAECNDPDLQFVIVLACANISFDNSSFPRGLLFHSSVSEQNIMVQCPFLSRDVRPCPVYNFRPYQEKDIQRTREQLQAKAREGQMTSRELELALDCIHTIYASDAVFHQPTYSDQMTMTNFHLWQSFFQGRKNIPANLLYIEQEGLVSELILEHHLDRDTNIYHILFDRSLDLYIRQYFEGISGTFSNSGRWGTYLFWGLPRGSKYRMQLWKEGNYLVSNDDSFRIELTPESIRDALLNRIIYPSTMLDFMVLSLYYGLKCLGGFSQVNYLTFMKDAYIKMQVDRGMYRSVEMCARAQTKELVGDLSIAYLETKQKSLIPATGLDLVMHGLPDMWERFVDSAKNVTLREALDPMMPDFYRIIFPEPQRDEKLLTVTTGDIVRRSHVKDRIRPCASLL